MQAPGSLLGTSQTASAAGCRTRLSKRSRSQPNKAQPDVVVAFNESTKESSRTNGSATITRERRRVYVSLAARWTYSRYVGQMPPVRPLCHVQASATATDEMDSSW